MPVLESRIEEGHQMKWTTGILLVCALFAGARTPAAQAARVGTFDRQAIVIAYYNSPQWKQLLGQKQAELKAAQAAGDQKKVDELNKWGSESQDLAHKQLENSAPIDNVLAAIKPAIDEICKANNLAKVVPAPAPDSEFQTVDVTGQLLDWLKADDKTRSFIRQMQQK
jgi:hypothetical protein